MRAAVVRIYWFLVQSNAPSHFLQKWGGFITSAQSDPLPFLPSYLIQKQIKKNPSFTISKRTHQQTSVASLLISSCEDRLQQFPSKIRRLFRRARLFERANWTRKHTFTMERVLNDWDSYQLSIAWFSSDTWSAVFFSIRKFLGRNNRKQQLLI